MDKIKTADPTLPHPPAEDIQRQALDALNRMQSILMMDDGRHPRDVLRAFIQLASLPEVQTEPDAEPFGYLYPTGRHPEFRYFQNKRDGVDGMPVYTAPQPAKPAEQEPFTVLVRKHSWPPHQWEAAPCGYPDYGKQWADERINVYTAPQPAAPEPDVEPVAEIQIEDMGRPFNAMIVTTHFYKGVPPVGTKLYTAPQPAKQPPHMAVQALAGEIIDALIADEKDGGYDLTAGLFGPAFSALVRRWANAEWNAPQPAKHPLTYEQIAAAVDQAKADV